MRALPVTTLLLLSACTRDGAITKINSTPEAQITSPVEGQELLEGDTVTLRGQVSDANHDASELSARWFADGIETCAAAAPAADGSTTCTLTVPALEALEVRLEAIDPDGAAGTDAATFAIVPDVAPTVAIEAPTEDGVYYTDQLLVLRALADDAEDAPDALVVRWESNLDGALGEAQADSEGVVETYVYLSEGTHAVQAFVTDSAGNEGRSSVLIDVGPPNSAPSCAIVAPLSGSAGEVGATVTFMGLVDDADIPADRLSVTWTSDKDGLLGTSAPTSTGSVTFPYADLSADTHVVTLRVQDDVGATCTTEVLYTVGTPPLLEILDPADGDLVNEGASVALRASVSDSEDTPSELLLRVDSDVDGLLDEGPPDSTGAWSAYADTLTAGEHVLTFTVTDSDGLYAAETLLLTVNGLPSAPSVRLSPDAPDTADDLSVVFDAVSVDPEGDRLTYAYAWYVDGASSGASTSSVLPASATSSGQTWTVEVWASDGLGESPVGSASVTVADSPPSIASVSLTPGTAYTDDTLTCTASGATDPDGEAVTLGYAWTVDGVALSESGATLAGEWFDKGDSVACTVTPIAGSRTGAVLTSTAVTILNSAPTLTGAAISPSAPTRSSTLTCTASGASDDDGDSVSVSYAWTLDGVAAGASATLSGPFSPGSVATCTATPSDGTDAGTPATASVTITNTAPVVSSVTLSPGTVYTDDTVTASVSAADADGDAITLTYAWYVDGARVPETGASLSGTTWFERDETVQVIVTASDASGAGTPTASAELTVANSAPSTPSIAIAPSAPSGPETLTCGVTTGSTDADGDPLSYTMTWTVDGVAFGAATRGTWANDTVPSASVAFDDTWTCTTVASDGTDTSASVSASVTVTCEPGSSGSCPGDSCDDILAAGAAGPDGLYWIDPLGTGAYPAYCDMTNDGGGWTLLMSADGDSTYWGNNSSNWRAAGSSSAPSLLADADFHGQPYGDLATDEIRLCHESTSACYVFAHGRGIALQTFFTSGVSHVEYSRDMRGYSDTGTSALVSAYESQLGHVVWNLQCEWLGINEVRTNSGIGLMLDDNGGCSSRSGSNDFPDDGAFGVGLQSCLDANGCDRYGSGHAAGVSTGVDGVRESGNRGPWFVFGR